MQAGVARSASRAGWLKPILLFLLLFLLLPVAWAMDSCESQQAHDSGSRSRSRRKIPSTKKRRDASRRPLRVK
jgi:hypothetical protein